MGNNSVYYDEAVDFRNVKDVCEKTRLAVSRLENPYNLSDNDHAMYRDFLSRHRLASVKTFIDRNELRILPLLVKHRTIKKTNVAQLTEYARYAKKLDILSYLLNVSNEFRTHPRQMDISPKFVPGGEGAVQTLPGEDIKAGDLVWMCENPIPWQVLEIKGKHALLISKFALDCMPYNFRYEATDWNKCSLRRWLNHDFLTYAFSDEERRMMLPVEVDSRDVLHFSDNNSADRIFLMSKREAAKYFKTDDERKARVTHRASLNGLFTFFDEFGHWWLRSAGAGEVGAAFVKAYGPIVDCGGTIISNGYLKDFEYYGVRPCMYIKIRR